MATSFSRRVLAFTLMGLSCASVSVAQAVVPDPAAVPVVAPAPAPTASIPNSIKTAPNSLSASDAAVIAQFITTQVQGLSAAEPDVRSQARDALTTAVRVNGLAAGASSSYLFQYTSTLDSALLPLTTSPKMPVRLNVAILTAKVAADAPGQSLNLQRTVDSLLKNETDPAVLIWVFKAAQPVLPHSLLNPKAQFPAPNPLVNEILAKALQNQSGPVTEEAYKALTLDWQAQRNLAAPMFQTVIPAVQKVLAARVAVYKNGIPEEPILDHNYGILFLTHPAVMPHETPAQKLASIQLLHDLVSVAATRAAGAARGPKEELILLLQRESGALQVLTGSENAGPAAVAAMRGLSTLSSNSKPADFTEASRVALNALRAIPAFAQLAPAPQLSAGGPASTNGSP